MFVNAIITILRQVADLHQFYARWCLKIEFVLILPAYNQVCFEVLRFLFVLSAKIRFQKAGQSPITTARSHGRPVLQKKNLLVSANLTGVFTRRTLHLVFFTWYSTKTQSRRVKNRMRETRLNMLIEIYVPWNRILLCTQHQNSTCSDKTEL